MTKFKKRKNKKQNNVAQVLIALFFVGIAIGFAYVHQTLSINGDTIIANNTSFIFFDNLKELEGSVYTTKPAEIETNKTSISFDIRLRFLNDFYGFEVDVINDTDDDALLSKFAIEGLPEELLKYIDYTMKYSDGNELKLNDILHAHSKDTIQVRIDYKEIALNAEEIMGGKPLDLSFDINYVKEEKENSSELFSRLSVSSAKLDSSVNFTNAPSSSNGEGLMVRNGTQTTEHPVYYYRGAVTNNNVLFAGQCWKIVRTTETGGIKLIYNGVPSSNRADTCTNTTGVTTQLDAKTYTFNTNNNALADVGYMYGTRYGGAGNLSTTTSFYHATSATYGTYYTLSGTKSSTTNGNRGTKNYTIGSTSSTAGSYTLYYVFRTGYYIALTGGDMMEQARDKMLLNTNKSNALTILDTWYESNLLKYDDYMDDAVWCNDRKIISGSFYSATVASNDTMFAGSATSVRNLSTTPKPAFDSATACPREDDRFTVSYFNGNGALEHPIGLITADEATFAGNGKTASTTSYLYTGSAFWTLTPYSFLSNTYVGANMYIVNSSGALGYTYTTTASGIRPSIVLKSDTKVYKGDGTPESPYVVEIDYSRVNKD